MDHGPGSADRILDAAQDMIRSGGYAGFSFRDVAVAVGMKSASVHYHFPTKPALVVALVGRFGDRVFAALPPPGEMPSRRALARYFALFRDVVESGQMCLCGVLAAEITALPEEVGAAVRGFTERNLRWLESLIAAGRKGRVNEGVRLEALRILAAVEGGMVLARALGEPAVLDRVIAPFLDSLPEG
jgi:TetR/AcrR family transcriptional repressor of nem operon